MTSKRVKVTEFIFSCYLQLSLWPIITNWVKKIVELMVLTETLHYDANVDVYLQTQDNIELMGIA